MQPETHNAFVFAGSVAKLLRRVPSLMIHLYLEDNKSLFNPLRIIDAVEECVTYVKNQLPSEKVNLPEVESLEQSPCKSAVTPVHTFDAGVRKS